MQPVTRLLLLTNHDDCADKQVNLDAIQSPRRPIPTMDGIFVNNDGILVFFLKKQYLVSEIEDIIMYFVSSHHYQSTIYSKHKI